MKKIILLLLLAPISVFAQNSISYKINYGRDLENDGLKIQLLYEKVEASDSTIFFYNNNSWGETDLFNSIQVRNEDNQNYSFKLNKDEHQIIVYHPKTKHISFTYRIKQDFPEPDYKTTFRPIIHNQYFHILGYSLFVVPEYFVNDDFNEKMDVTIEWVGFPEDFKIHNTYDSETKIQKLNVRLWEELFHSVFVGGDYRIYRFDHHNKPIYFAVRDTWMNGFTDDFLVSNFKKAIISQRDFWKDYSQDYFTAILTPTVTQEDSLFKGNNLAGSAVKNGFTLQATNNPFNNKQIYIYTLHHELMHHWIGGKIQNKYKELNYWFSEGFTDYYTHKNRLRIKDITIQEWVDFFNNEIMAVHWNNSKRNIPNYEIAEGFWKSRDISNVPYKRGAIFAFWLDNQILIKSNGTKSLDDLMNDLLEKCIKENVKFSDELLIDLATNYLDINIFPFFQKHIINGEDVDLLNEKWIEGFEFSLIDSIPQLKLTNTESINYIVETTK
ncbi:hypothetical protein ACFCT7_08675 [Fulvivirgaceae bacterium LMO-SS25]